MPPSKYVRWLDVGLPVAVGLLVLAALALVSLGGVEYEGAGKSFAFGLGAGIALNFVRRPLRFGLAVGAIVLAGSVPLLEEGIELRQDRSFFGVIRVERSEDGRVQRGDPRHHHPRRPAARSRPAAHSADLLPPDRPRGPDHVGGAQPPDGDHRAGHGVTGLLQPPG